MISFFVPGVPKSTQTGTVVRAGGRTFPVRRGTSWSAVCGLMAREANRGGPFEGPVRVLLEFRLPRPKSGKRKYPTTRPDVENLTKGLLDSWNGCLWKDDSQVIDLRILKEYADAPGVQVQVLEAV